jgi:hypothetical protein
MWRLIVSMMFVVACGGNSLAISNSVDLSTPAPDLRVPVGVDLAAVLVDLAVPDLTGFDPVCAPGQPAGLCVGKPCAAGCTCLELITENDLGFRGVVVCDCSAPTGTNPAPTEYMCCDGVWCQGVGSMEPYCDQKNVGPGCYPGFSG